MNMKKFLNLLLMFPLAATMMIGCQSEEITYTGPEYVMFADTTYTMPFQLDESNTLSCFDSDIIRVVNKIKMITTNSG